MGVASRRRRGGPALRTFRGTVSYDGTDFSGWQVQAGRRTVQGVLEEALAGVLGGRVPILAAGRTDAGVHAEGQGISFRAPTRIPPAGIAAACNAALPEDVAVLDIEEAPAAFHATFDAASKVYRYVILCSRTPRPLLRRTAWRVPGQLDAARIRRAARLLEGRHDFHSFRTNPGVEGGTTVRTLRRVDVHRRGDLLFLEFEGDGFLYNMVRSMVGTLVLVGRGTWDPARVGEALRAADRRAAGPTAPPQGLTLVRVEWGSRRKRPGKSGKIAPPPSRRA